MRFDSILVLTYVSPSAMLTFPGILHMASYLLTFRTNSCSQGTLVTRKIYLQLLTTILFKQLKHLILCLGYLQKSWNQLFHIKYMTVTLQQITLDIELTLIYQFLYILECILFAVHCHLCLFLSKLYWNGESWTQLLKLLGVNSYSSSNSLQFLSNFLKIGLLNINLHIQA